MAETKAETQARRWRLLTRFFLGVSLVGFAFGCLLVVETVQAAMEGKESWGAASQATLAVAVFSVSMMQAALGIARYWKAQVDAEEDVARRAI